MQASAGADDDIPMYAEDPPDDFSDLQQAARRPGGQPSTGTSMNEGTDRARQAGASGQTGRGGNPREGGTANPASAASTRPGVAQQGGASTEHGAEQRTGQWTEPRAGQGAASGTASAAAPRSGAASAAGASAESPDLAGTNELSARVVALEAELAAATLRATENHEQHLRAVAEMENVRRRAQEDVSKAHKFAIETFAENLLPVKDSLELALQVDVPSVERLREGVEATLRQLTQAFERNRLTEIDPLHQKFDPHQHQAISMAPSKEVAPNHIVSVLQKGYKINDRILRPALVTVSQSS